jgi:hypothetical protein
MGESFTVPVMADFSDACSREVRSAYEIICRNNLNLIVPAVTSRFPTAKMDVCWLAFVSNTSQKNTEQ